jgi:hypothetical protein
LAKEYLADTLYRSKKDESTKKTSDRARASSSSSYENKDDEIDVKNDDEVDVKNDDSDNVYTFQNDASLDNDDISNIDEDLKGLNRIKNFDDVEIKTTDRQKKRKTFWRNIKK